MTEQFSDLRLKVAIASRILGMLGLVRESTGHVSARIPGTEEMWLRCRGGDEAGNAFTGLHNVRRVDFDGQGPGLGPVHASPTETPIHGEIYRAHPEVGAVIHAHPYYALMAGITRLEFRPVFGAYDPSGLNMVLQGVPVFPRSVTVNNKETAAAMLESMGERDVLLMQGHGITATGPALEQATTLAIRFDRTAQIMWELALSGREAPPISDEDLARYDRRNRPPRAPRGWRAQIEGAENFAWNHYVRLLQASSFGLPDDLDAD